MVVLSIVYNYRSLLGFGAFVLEFFIDVRVFNIVMIRV